MLRPPRRVRTVVTSPESAVAAARFALSAGSERVLVCGFERLADIHWHVRELERGAKADGWTLYMRTGRSVQMRKDDTLAAVRFHHYLDRDEPFEADTIVVACVVRPSTAQI